MRTTGAAAVCGAQAGRRGIKGAESAILINPRRACASRVTVLVSARACKGEERKGSKVKVGREI